MKLNFWLLKKGEITPYRRSVFEERTKKVKKEMISKDF